MLRRRIFAVLFTFGLLPCLLACMFTTQTPPEPEILPRSVTPYDTSTAGLPDPDSTATLDVRDGDTVRLTVGWVAKKINGHKIRMLAYNRSIPGPTIRVPQGARVTVILGNNTKLSTSLHSHGIRMDGSQNDGAMETPSTDSGQTFAYHLNFPDPGYFWYHPHRREDYQQELGLYGNYVVVPSDSAYWPPVSREMPLMLCDMLLKGSGPAAYFSDDANYIAMGRFGNVFLVNGDTVPVLHVKRNEVIRFYATNASSARIYNLQFSDPQFRMNLIGSDNGRSQWPKLRASDLIGASERLVFQVRFHDTTAQWDTVRLRHVTPYGTFLLAKFAYDSDTASPDLASSITTDESPIVRASIDPFRPYFNKAPDKRLKIWGYMDHNKPLIAGKEAAVAYDPLLNDKIVFKDWYDNMGAMNAQSDTASMNWFLHDEETGLDNHDIHWTFHKGDKVKISIYNDSTSLPPPGKKWMMHPMPHPIHFHGQRFLVVKQNGIAPDDSLVWKDTYLVGPGFTVELLLDASNIGDWMFHCHIAEHLTDGMMGHFSVTDP